MKLIPFGETTRLISNLCLSTDSFGWNTDARTAHAILDTFCAHGGNFVLASSGVNALSSARSEAYLGSWTESRDIMRDELTLATKLVIRPEVALSRSSLTDFVRRCCEESLRRLRVDYLDVLLCDFRSSVLPVSALLEALEYLRAEGLVEHFGASKWPIQRVREAHRYASAGEVPSLAILEDDYSVVAPTHFETHLAHACRETAAMFLASSPMAGGFLSESANRSRGWYSAGDRMWLGEPGSRSTRPGMRDLIERFALSRGASVTETAVAWVLAHPKVSAAVVGVTSPDELEPLLAAAREPLTQADASLLTDLLRHGGGLDPLHEYTELEA